MSEITSPPRPLPAIATGAVGFVLGTLIGAAMLSSQGKMLLLIALILVIGPSLVFRGRRGDGTRVDVGRWLMARMGALAERLSPGFAPRDRAELQLRRVTYIIGLAAGVLLLVLPRVLQGGLIAA